jgi:hypothetical protein
VKLVLPPWPSPAIPGPRRAPASGQSREHPSTPPTVPADET